MKIEQTKDNIGIICIALCIAGGMLGFGKFSFHDLRPNTDLIEVKGLSEKIVNSDIAEIKITIKNDNTDISALYQKSKEDKEKVIAYLKQAGFESDIYKFDFTTNSYEDHIYEDGKVISKEKRFSSFDYIFLKTTKFDQIENLKTKLAEFGIEKILISFDCTYKLLDFKGLRLSMLAEAAQNAKDSARAFVKNFNGVITNLVYLRQGEITITSDTESEQSNRWESMGSEKASFRKKLRLIVRAGFKHK